MGVSGVGRSERWPGGPVVVGWSGAVGGGGVGGGPPVAAGDRRSGAGSTSGAPHVGQNLVPAATGEPQRPQLGPEPGAVRRRPQCGQNGRRPLARPPQKGHVSASGRVGATTGGATPRVPGTAVPTAAALTPEALPMGLPQSIQNCAPASFSRPQ